MNSTAPSLLLLLALAPVTATAAVSLQSSRQNVNRLTLLPGPYLTSPGGAPQAHLLSTAADGMIPMSPPPVFAPQPTPRPAAPLTTVRLGNGTEETKTFAPAPKPRPPQDPDTLRFENQLAPSAKRSLLEPAKHAPAPAPKRD